MKKLIIALILFTTLVQAQEVIYQPNYADIRNPERGFYCQKDSWNSDAVTYPLNYVPLSTTNVVSYCNGKNITVVQRIVRLDNYKSTATIPTLFLNKVLADLDYLKDNGLKCILRFCYSSYSQNASLYPDPPNLGNLNPTNVYEPTKSILIGHISQIKYRLDDSPNHEAAISSIEAGFIGNWGEWYYSKTTTAGGTPVSEFGLGDPDIIDANPTTFLQNRTDVASAIMDMAPSRMVAFRTPYFQKLLAPSNNLGKQAPFYTGTPFSRIACHNDAFVSNLLDDGTYRDIWNPNTGMGDGGATDRSYLKGKSKHTFTGGESNSYETGTGFHWATCVNNYNSAINTLGKNAIQQMEDYHYNYLNEVYFPAIMNPSTGLWANTTIPALAGGGNYLSEVKRRLGYRFVLEKSYITPISNNTNNKLTIEFKNVGFANVFNKRPVYLVLKSSTLTYKLYINGPADFSSSNPPAPGVILGTDVRSWDAYDFTPPTPPVQPAGPIKLTKTLNGLTDINGATIQNGTYQLYLELPDETFTNLPSHSIQFANTGNYSKTVGSVTTNYTGATFWDSLTGLNNLFQSITVLGSNGSKMASGSATAFDVISSPNPFNNTFKLNIQASSEESITVKVFDMLGKLIENQTIAASELENLEIGSKLSSGIYNVVVTQGENEKTVRVIKN